MGNWTKENLMLISGIALPELLVGIFRCLANHNKRQTWTFLP
jgi:hypothetical protein